MPSENNPSVSICIPAYKRTTFIRQTLESCLSQDYPNFNTIISDDSDHTEIRDLCASFGSDKITYIKNPTSLGLNRKLNQFLEISDSDWMLILCDDDYLEPGYLKSVMDLVKANPKASLVRTRYRLVDIKSKLIRLDKVTPSRLNSLEFMSILFLPHSKNFKMNISAVLFRRKNLKDLGGFPYFHKAWHVDCIAWGLLSTTGDCVTTDEALCNIRLHGGSITGSIDPNYRPVLESTLKLKPMAEQLFKRLEPQITGEVDQYLFDTAQRRFNGYFNRHLNRALDHGFVGALSEKDQKKAQEAAREIFRVQDQMCLPPSNSSRYYAWLAKLPSPLRLAGISLIRTIKTKKWQD